MWCSSAILCPASIAGPAVYSALFHIGLLAVDYLPLHAKFLLRIPFVISCPVAIFFSFFAATRWWSLQMRRRQTGTSSRWRRRRLVATTLSSTSSAARASWRFVTPALTPSSDPLKLYVTGFGRDITIDQLKAMFPTADDVTLPLNPKDNNRPIGYDLWLLDVLILGPRGGSRRFYGTMQAAVIWCVAAHAVLLCFLDRDQIGPLVQRSNLGSGPVTPASVGHKKNSWAAKNFRQGGIVFFLFYFFYFLATPNEIF